MDDRSPDDVVSRLQSRWERPDACPPAAKLTAFANRELPAEEMLSIRRHVERCGLCDWALTSLKDFDSALVGASKSPGFRFPLRFLLRPSFAYLLVLALVYPAYRGIFQQHQRIVYLPGTVPRQPVVARQLHSAHVYDLGEATAKRGSSPYSTLREITVDNSEQFLVLHFYIPVHPDHVYRMEIRRETASQTIVSAEIRSQDPLGNFSVVAQTSLFSNGDYLMVVEEIEKRTGIPIDRYHFPLHVTFS